MVICVTQIPRIAQKIFSLHGWGENTRIEHISIKKASRSTLKKMRQLGVEKAERLQLIQQRWEKGEYSGEEIVSI